MSKSEADFIAGDLYGFISEDLLVDNELAGQIDVSYDHDARNPLTICATHLAGGVLLKMQKHFEVMLKIFEISRE